jgi:hypothetical protein
LKYFAVSPETKKPAVRWSNRAKWLDGPPPEGTWHAIPCGKENGVWVLDLDVKPATGRQAAKNGLVAISEAFPEGLPDTRTVRTAGGGLHLYFNWVDGLRGRIGMLPGVDVKSAGGYVLGPGTPGYVLVADLPIADAPDALIAFINGASEGPLSPSKESAISIDESHCEWEWRLEQAEKFLASAPICVSGEGGDGQLLAVALRLMRTYELPHDTAINLLAPYNARCKPPWLFAELSRKLIFAAEHGHGPTGTFDSTALTWGNTVPAGSTVPPVKGYRQVRNPDHVYTFESGVELQGGDVSRETTQIDERVLATAFVGPYAPEAWRGVFQYDEFADKIIAVNPPTRLDAELSKGMSDNDLTEMRFWLIVNTFQTAAKGAILEVVEAAAKKCRFHPVRDYLDGLPKPSIDEAQAYFANIASRLWGAIDYVDLESDMFKRQCVAAVRRIRVPGTKVDEMLIFHGDQGMGKSRLLAKMFGLYFSDQIHGDWQNKDAADAIQGMWGIEVGEVGEKTGGSSNVRKSFLSRTFDHYRKAYNRLTGTYQRQCVFFGSSNEDDLFNDATGNRRYNVVHVERDIDVDAFDRDALWAAANVLEAAGEIHFFSREQSGAMAELKAAHASSDPWSEQVLKYCAGRYAAGERFISSTQVLTMCIQMPVLDQDQKALNRVGSILRIGLGARKSHRVGDKTLKGHRLRA